MSSAPRSPFGFFHFLPLLVTGLVLLGLFNLLFYGNFDQVVSSAVLSENDSSDDNSGSSNSGSGSDNSGSGSENSGSSDDEDDDREETEIRFEDIGGDAVRVRTREEDGRQRTDIYRNGTKLRIETRDGVTKISLENEEDEVAEEFELEDEDEIGIEEATDEGEIRVLTRRNRFIIRRNNIDAATDFPVSVDLETNELVINTPAGERRVAILPDAAVNNMLAQNAVDRVLRDEVTGEEEVELTIQPDGSVVYEVSGVTSERLLGLFDVLVPKTGVVSAENGQVLDIRQNLVSLVLDFLSF